MYIIIKHVKTHNDRKLPVILLDTQGEVWEFDNKDKAKIWLIFLTLIQIQVTNTKLKKFNNMVP
jgi:hypothetical protein